MTADQIDAANIDGWLKPLDGPDGPCGKDFEYDNEFLELNKAAEGKPETQFGPGEPPDWRGVREKSSELMCKTRDLRIALLWVRAMIHLQGFSALSSGLRLINGMLSNFWDNMHPLPDPDDGDPYARANALATLPEPVGLLGDLRETFLFRLRGVGELKVRAIEVGLGYQSALDDEIALTKDQLVQMIAAAASQLPELQSHVTTALNTIDALNITMRERLGAQSAPELRPLTSLVKAISTLMPSMVEADSDAAISQPGEVVAIAAGRLGGVVQSREDALRAITMVCEFLDRTEPSNPAQLLLRRASRLINQNFLQLVKELAPESLIEVARVMGVDPETIVLD